MYTQYFLRFSSQEEFHQEMINADYYLEESEQYKPPGLGSAIDIIGDIYNGDAIFNENGELIQEPTKLDGYHVNLILPENVSLDESLNNYIVTPLNPYRVFFGY